MVLNSMEFWMQSFIWWSIKNFDNLQQNFYPSLLVKQQLETTMPGAQLMFHKSLYKKNVLWYVKNESIKCIKKILLKFQDMTIITLKQKWGLNIKCFCFFSNFVYTKHVETMFSSFLIFLQFFGQWIKIILFLITRAKLQKF